MSKSILNETSPCSHTRKPGVAFPSWMGMKPLRGLAFRPQLGERRALSTPLPPPGRQIQEEAIFEYLRN